jgi:hypothetical protein
LGSPLPDSADEPGAAANDISSATNPANCQLNRNRLRPRPLSQFIDARGLRSANAVAAGFVHDITGWLVSISP